ncbi:MAG: hypothetical protein GWN64_07930 [Candidatus Thorarchaeota archaeon]|nr:hypothetical protein [Candidatus Thorarchaeota archaeon]
MPGNPDIPNLPTPPMPPLETMPFTTTQGLIAILYDLWLKAQGLNGRILVSTEIPGAITLELAYDEEIEIEQGYFYNGAQFTVPSGYKFVVASITSYSADNRVTVKTNQAVTFGTYNPDTQVFTAGTSTTFPNFMSGIDLKITADMGNVDDIVITVTYTNQDGVTGRTAHTDGIKIKKLQLAGNKVPMFLQGGDFGVRSVQAVIADKTNTGAIEIQGLKNFFYQRIKEADTSYSLQVPRESILIPAGEILNIDVGTNGTAETRRIVRLNGYLVPV